MLPSVLCTCLTFPQISAVSLQLLHFIVILLYILLIQLASGEEIPLPPIILGRLGSDPGKKTVCIYGHLDVQPATIDDGWDTEPFTLVEKDGKSRAFSFTLGTKLPYFFHFFFGRICEV